MSSRSTGEARYLNFTNEPYPRDIMLALRIKHIRDALSAVNGNASMIASLNDLAAHGITANLIVDYGISSSSIASCVGQLNAGVVESLEGPNELNSCCHDANWIADDQAEMPEIKTAVTTYPALAEITIYRTVIMPEYLPNPAGTTGQKESTVMLKFLANIGQEFKVAEAVGATVLSDIDAFAAG